MADITKYAPINGGTVMSDLKAQFSIFRTNRKSSTLAYAFVFVFIAFTIFLAFTPSTNSSTPWLTSTLSFTNNTTSTSSSSNSMNSIFSEESYRSHFSPIVNYFFPNSSSSSSSSQQSLNSSDNNNAVPQSSSLPHPESNKDANATNKVEVLDQNYDSNMPHKPLVTLNNNTIPSQPLSEFSKGSKNQTQNSDLIGQVASFTANQTVIGVANTTLDTSKTDLKNVTADGDKVIAHKGKQINGTNAVKQGKKGIDDLIGCDLFDGNWVSDDSYPLYKPGSCSLIDEQFNCFRNGRPDNGYQKLKWKPKGCTLPRLDGIHMLELLRGKRLVFVGDSLNRNMWESLICILKNSVKDKKKVYEASGRQHFRTEAAYAFVFEEYKCTVEFFVSPFLVQEWEVADKNGTKKETLRLDLISSHADKYKSADIIVFNTGHWWTHEKTSKGEDYYQEGSHVYKELNVLEAFRKAITTWGRWVDAHVNPMKSLVFFRGYSASHFSGGQWNSGGQCDNETEPIKNDKYLTQYPPKMSVLENVLQGMKTNITYLNVTRLTDYRKDGHPSIYRKQHYSDEEKRTPLIFQDCSHWCLPGVPDAWNELLYAELLVKLNQKQQQKIP